MLASQQTTNVPGQFDISRVLKPAAGYDLVIAWRVSPQPPQWPALTTTTLASFVVSCLPFFACRFFVCRFFV